MDGYQNIAIAVEGRCYETFCHQIITTDMNEKTEMMADMVKNLAVLLLEQNNELSMEQALS